MIAYAIIWIYLGDFMPNISVRKLDKKAYERLRIQAANHGVSMEEEARQIIYRAVSAPEKISVIFQKHFGSKNGIDLDLDSRKPHEPMDFSE
jgi:plasmid stability protein